MFRTVLSPFRSLPQFVIIGAQKCGTTALYEYLALHPKVVSSYRKELHYFDNDFARSQFWYRKHFPFWLSLKLQGAITGEATPNYIHYPPAAERMARVIPHAKLFAVLRNPVDRAISHYWWEVRNGREKGSIQEALQREREQLAETKARLEREGNYKSGRLHTLSYVDRGMYAEQLEHYFRHFPREQIMVIKSEELSDNTQAVMDQAYAFLGLEPHRLQSEKRHNKGTYREEIDPAVRAELTEHFRPHNQRLYELLQLKEPWW